LRTARSRPSAPDQSVENRIGETLDTEADQAACDHVRRVVRGGEDAVEGAERRGGEEDAADNPIEEEDRVRDSEGGARVVGREGSCERLGRDGLPSSG
jgi:hypothetical protein